MSTRFFLLDYGGFEDDSICGKDLFETNAPKNILKLATEEVRDFKENHHCASELFVEYVEMCGYWAKPVVSLEELPIHGAHNDNF